MRTKRLHISMAYTFVGDTGIDIPVNLLKGKTEEEQLEIAFKYAQDHIDEIPVADNAEYISCSDNFEKEDIDFDDAITEEMYQELKSAVWNNGVEAIDDLLGYEHDVEEDNDTIESRMDMVLDQMPPEVFMDFYNRYCDKEMEQEEER